MFLTRKSLISNEKIPLKGEKTLFRFKREEHLKGRKEIKEVFGRGKRYSCKGAKLFVLKNELPYNRICFSLFKGFGNAVSRNRAKRLGREAYRLIKYRLLGGYDLILLVSPETEDQSSSTLSYRIWQLESLFLKAGLLE
ncbi:ribonuclease P protein component [Treponema sp. R6D11]